MGKEFVSENEVCMHVKKLKGDLLEICLQAMLEAEDEYCSTLS